MQNALLENRQKNQLKKRAKNPTLYMISRSRNALKSFNRKGFFRQKEQPIRPKRLKYACTLLTSGPQACAEAMEEEYGLKLSHHLVDEFLEGRGKSYQDMKPGLIQEALEKDWRPFWLPAATDVPSEEVEIQPCRCLPLTGADASGSKPSLEGLVAPSLEGLVAEKGAEALPAVQCDAMNLTILSKVLKSRSKNGKSVTCHRI